MKHKISKTLNTSACLPRVKTEGVTAEELCEALEHDLEMLRRSVWILRETVVDILDVLSEHSIQCQDNRYQNDVENAKHGLGTSLKLLQQVRVRD